MAEDADVIVVGGGLAGLVAATEIADAGKRVIVVDQEGEQSLGGQAFWSFGGLFLVDSPEQRRLGIRDSYDLALQDWIGKNKSRTTFFMLEHSRLPRLKNLLGTARKLETLTTERDNNKFVLVKAAL